MSKIRTAFLFLIGIAGAGPLSHSEERRTFYSGIRGMSMGGATIATVNDETALLSNPAALGKLRDFYGTILDPEVEISSGNLSMYKTKTYTGFFDLESIKDTLDSSRGAYFHSKYQLFPSFVGRNFGIGLYTNKILDAKMSEDGTSIQSFYRNDIALALGYNFRFFDGRVKLGFNTKVINRIEYNESAIPVTDLSQVIDLTPYYKEGTGVSFDAGLILTAPWEFLPTISVVAHDVGDTRFDKSTGVRMTTTNQPNMVQQDADIAIAIFPINTKLLRTTWTLQYDGLLLGKNETDKSKLIHAGFEMNFSDIFFLRAGYNQRYFTGGIELATEHFQFQFATYGVEIGTETANYEDRRYGIKTAFRF